MSLVYVTFDVFTTTPFRGNPLAIVRVPTTTDLSHSVKLLIAREFNYSETVFLHEQTPIDIQLQQSRIDIFTPYDEIPYAGHPTIGVANYLLYHHPHHTSHTLITKSGPVPFQAATLDSQPAASLKVAHDVHIHKRRHDKPPYEAHPLVSIVNGMNAILAQVPDVDTLAQQTENLVGAGNTYRAQKHLDHGWREGPVITYYYVDQKQKKKGKCKDGVRARKLRARNLGAREDPGTGSAAAALGCYLSLTEDRPERTRCYEVVQGVEMGRMCKIRVVVTLRKDQKKVEEVLLLGNAVKVFEGRVPIPGVAKL